jgi:hypothetical protein
MAQLSELLRSPGCVKGPESLHEIANPSQVKFVQWIQLDLKGKSDSEELDTIRDEYQHICDLYGTRS